jgi:hypothetical protein
MGPLGISAINWPIVPATNDNKNEEFGGIMIGRGNRNTRRKPAAVPLCPPQIPHDLTGREPGDRDLNDNPTGLCFILFYINTLLSCSFLFEDGSVLCQTYKRS